MNEEKLLHLLRKKKNFFEVILELTENESTLSISEWISVLEQKKILLSCIDDLDREIRSFQRKLTDLSQEITDELEAIRTVIRRILQRDTLNQEKRKIAIKNDESP